MILLKSIKVKKKGSKISKTRARDGGASVFTSFLSFKATASAKRAFQQTGKNSLVGMTLRPPAFLPAETRAPSEARGEANRLWWTRGESNP